MMIFPGFSLSFFPTRYPQSHYIVMMYVEEWEDGTCVRSEGLQRTALDIDMDWLRKIPVDQLAATVLEIASQMLVVSATEQQRAELSETVASCLRAVETPSEEM